MRSRLVLRRFNLRFGRWQSPGWLGRFRWFRDSSRDTAGDAFYRAPVLGSSANLDSIVLVVDHDVRSAIAHAAAGLRLTVVAVNFQLREVGLDFAVAGAGIDVESGLVRQAQVDRAIAAVNLDIAERTHGHFDPAVFILQADIARYVIQANLLGARRQMKRPSNLVGVEVIGIEGKIAIDAREFQVGAGGLEVDVPGDAG